jgi:O-antigen ligase
MFRFARTFIKEPLRAVGILWPLALLIPFAPGLPRPGNGGLTWRQEAVIALLLAATFALLLRRRAPNSAHAEEAHERTNVHLDRFASAIARFASVLARFAPTTSRFAPVNARFTPVVAHAQAAFALPLAGFVLWAAASTLWAANLFGVLHYILSWTTYILFFFVLRRVAESPRLLRASTTTLATVVVVISAANVVGYYGSPDSLIRQNGLGEPVAVSIPLFAALALRVRQRRAAMLCGAAATLGWLSMLEIAERAPFFGVLTGLVLVAAFMLTRACFRPRTTRRTFALAAAFAACLALQYVPSPFAQSLHEPVFVRVKQTSTQEINTRARLLFWGAAVEMWRMHPLTGVGAGGYSSAYPQARAAFSARRPDSRLVDINEQYLNAGAHNEYLQILSELGVVGLALFMVFCAALVWAAWRALRSASSPLVPAAVASLATFAISSGASAVSFRWFGSGLMFFFAAAIVARFAHAPRRREADSREGAAHLPESTVQALESTASAQAFVPSIPSTINARPAYTRPVYALGLVAALVVLAAMCVQATNVVLLASAQVSPEPARAEPLYRTALRFNPLDPATHFNFGLWLYSQKREREALPHLRYAVARGFGTSTCYEYLAGAESNAGELDAAERTLSEAVRVYPRSIFIRVRHAAALGRLGRGREAEMEMAAAMLIDSRLARGWQRLIDDDIDAAIAANKSDPNASAMPGELRPEDGVFAVLQENERRFPGAVSTGWRARVRAQSNHDE